jgi:hypothetical protein
MSNLLTGSSRQEKAGGRVDVPSAQGTLQFFAKHADDVIGSDDAR